MYKFIVGILFGLLLLDGRAMAACFVPNSLTNGTTADATAVMGNFTSLAGCAAPLASPSFSGTLTAPDGSIWTSDNGLTIASAGTSGATVDNTLSFRSVNHEVSLNGNSSGNLTLQGDGTGTNSILINNSTQTLAIGFWAGSQRMALLNNGYLGIGTASPSYPLYVNGTAYASGAAGALSDVRHKKNVASLPDGALEDVLRLRPVSFFWKNPKDDGMKGRQMGFIAQDVEGILPSAVLTASDAEKTKGLKYNELIAVLTKAVQEQEVEIRALRAANNDLAADFTHLKIKIGALEKSDSVQTVEK